MLLSNWNIIFDKVDMKILCRCSLRKKNVKKYPDSMKQFVVPWGFKREIYKILEYNVSFSFSRQRTASVQWIKQRVRSKGPFLFLAHDCSRTRGTELSPSGIQVTPYVKKKNSVHPKGILCISFDIPNPFADFKNQGSHKSREQYSPSP